MTMRRAKTINLIEGADSVHGEPNGVYSAVATGLLTLMLAFVATALSPDPAVVVAEAPTTRFLDRSRIEIDDPIAGCLARADGWIPWHQFFAALPEFVGETPSLYVVKYHADRKTIEIRGEAQTVSQLPELMLFLERVPWLAEPVPIRVVRDAKTGISAFTLRVDVLPYLELEAAL